MKKTIVVTGAASGIGLDVARQLADEGWRVVAADRNIEALTAAFPSIGHVERCALDVADTDSISALVAQLGARPVAALVNCAGLACTATFMETTAEDFRRIYEVNVIGAFSLSKALVPFLEADGGGAVVNVTSVSGLRGNIRRAAYGASKGGLNLLTQIMAVELADRNIRVNAVAPGPIETPMTREYFDESIRQTWAKVVPMRRFGESREVASAIAFLADGERSGYITGQILSVDGGFIAAGLMAER